MKRENPMEIQVNYIGFFRGITGVNKETVNWKGGNLADLIEWLSNRYGEKFKKAIGDTHGGKLRKGLVLAVNGQKSGLDHILTEGSEVSLIPPIVGGFQ